MSDDPRAASAGLAPVVSFIVIACLISWTDWGLVLASAHGWIPVRVPLNPWGSFGPAVAAVLVAAYRARGAGVRALLRPLLAWRFPLRWWLAAALVPAVLVGLSILAVTLGGATPLPAQVPDVAELLVLAVLLVVFGGPLGEEIGWRGYLLPELLRRTGPVAASLIIAAVWSVWHLPLFWVPGATQEGGSMLLFVGLVAGFSILTTWIYLRTSGSLLAVVVFHHSINLSTYFPPEILSGLAGTPAMERALLLFTWGAAGLVAWSLTRQARPVGAVETAGASP